MDMVNGKSTKIKQDAITLRATISLTRKMDREHLHGKVAISTRETTLMTSATVMERCTGPTARYIKEIGRRAFSMARDA